MREAIVQIDFDPQLLRRVSQLLNKFGIGKLGYIVSFLLFPVANIEHLVRLLAGSQLRVELEHGTISVLGVPVGVYMLVSGFRPLPEISFDFDTAGRSGGEAA